MIVVKGQCWPTRPSKEGAADVARNSATLSKHATDFGSGQTVGNINNRSTQNSGVGAGGVGATGSRYHVLQKDTNEDQMDENKSVQPEEDRSNAAMDRARKGKSKQNVGGLADRVESNFIASYPSLLNNI